MGVEQGREGIDLSEFVPYLIYLRIQSTVPIYLSMHLQFVVFQFYNINKQKLIKSLLLK